VNANPNSYGVPMIALYKRESFAARPSPQAREPLARIIQADFDALCREIGIDVESWSPDVREQAKEFPYPHIYAIQNYIVYEHQCKADEVSALLADMVIKHRASLHFSFESSSRRAYSALHTGSACVQELR
jgi:hypothetical protein